MKTFTVIKGANTFIIEIEFAFEEYFISICENENTKLKCVAYSKTKKTAEEYSNYIAKKLMNGAKPSEIRPFGYPLIKQTLIVLNALDLLNSNLKNNTEAVNKAACYIKKNSLDSLMEDFLNNDTIKYLIDQIEQKPKIEDLVIMSIYDNAKWGDKLTPKNWQIIRYLLEIVKNNDLPLTINDIPDKFKPELAEYL